MKQLSLFEEERPDLDSYDLVILALSGGKDSMACLMLLLEMGVPPEKIEVWHHLVDGREDEIPFFDWEITEDYCRAVCNHFRVPIYYSWREGGFKREMLKDGERTAPVWYESPDGLNFAPTSDRARVATRRKFPQTSGDLRTRWCTSSLKISVGDRCFVQSRFDGLRLLFITGERREESSRRAKYKEREDHKCSNKKRTVHHWRMVIDLDLHKVWEILERHRIVPHPAYWMGFARTSCQTCIFLGQEDWAAVNQIDRTRIDRISAYEREFANPQENFSGTISRDGRTVSQRISNVPVREIDSFWEQISKSREWTLPVQVSRNEWRMPPGAFGGDLSSGSS